MARRIKPKTEVNYLEHNGAAFCSVLAAFLVEACRASVLSKQTQR